MHPQPLPVRHGRNVLWWLILIGLILAGHSLPHYLAGSALPYSFQSSLDSQPENDAFIALAFGKVSTSHELAISATALDAYLTALKQAGYSSVRLEQINRWRRMTNEPLPTKPVLLTFEEANRETIEIADSLLASAGMTALVFVDVEQLNQANIHLVSWHKLELMVKSGRWEIGISACPNGDDQAFANPELLAQRITRQRVLLEQRLGVPVMTADCSRALNVDYSDGADVWNRTLQIASLQAGFVAAPPGANYRNDPEFNFRRIRVAKSWNPDELLSQLDNHAPRRTGFIDQFQSEESASAWVVDSGEIMLGEGQLQIVNKSGEMGGLITLAGTEKWLDADVEVQLKEPPKGQFWLYLRHGDSQPSVRLGVANGQIILQTNDVNGVHRQMASVDAPAGDISLRLRVVGLRAIGYLNGQPLIRRPIAVPDGAERGAFTLAVWNQNEQADTIQAGDASVELLKVSATPLFPKSGLVAPRLDEAGWAQLQSQVERLSMLSPGYFVWLDSTPRIFADRDASMTIFARYHHLKMLPAVFVNEDTPLSDRESLGEQVLVWCSDSDYDGLNMVLQSTMVDDDWQAFLRLLSQRMSQMNKTLTVTLLEANEVPKSVSGTDQLQVLSAQAELLPVGPRVLYTQNTQFTAE